MNKNFVKATIVIWSLAFIGGFVTGKSAFATQPYNVQVNDHQKTVIKRTPQVVEVCSERNVSGDKTADTILGAIIGGLLGHQNSTASDGTKLVCKNMTRYKESMDTIYSHSTITFNYNGKTYTARFSK